LREPAPTQAAYYIRLWIPQKGKRQILSLFIDRIDLESLKKNGRRKPEKRVKVFWNDIIST